MDYKDKRACGVEKFLSTQLENIFYDRTEETLQLFAANRDRVYESFFAELNNGVNQASRLIRSNQKKPINYMHFSYLLSNVIQNKLTVKIDFYDSRYFYDTYDVDSYWDFSFLFPYIEDDMQKINREMEKRFVRVMPYELLDIRMLYHVGVFMLMEDIIKALINSKEFNQALSSLSAAKLIVLYGAFQDQSEVIRIFEMGD